MNVRQVLLGAGGLLCLAVGTLVQDVGTAVTEPFSGTGGDYVLMAVLSGLALLAAVPVVVSGREGTLKQTETPDPEIPVEVPPAGVDFDETVRGWRFRTPIVGDSTRKQVKDRLQRGAVGALMRAENCGRGRARRLVREGEWTDDTEAAAFLGSATQSVTVTTAAALLRRQTPGEYRARRTAEAIHAVEDGERR